MHVSLGGLHPPSTQSYRPRFPHAMPQFQLLSTSWDKPFSLQQPPLPLWGQGHLLCVPSSCATRGMWSLLQACKKYLKLIYSVWRVWYSTQNKILTPYSHYCTVNYTVWHVWHLITLHTTWMGVWVCIGSSCTLNFLFASRLASQASTSSSLLWGAFNRSFS